VRRAANIILFAIIFSISIRGHSPAVVFYHYQWQALQNKMDKNELWSGAAPSP